MWRWLACGGLGEPGPARAGGNAGEPTVSFHVEAPARVLEGDPIPLQLVFRASTPGVVTVDAATYDRGGRLTSERYVVDPPAPDPLADWYDQGPMAFGGLRRMPVLGTEPEVVEVSLAEHLRLSPGTYTLTVTTDRASVNRSPLALTAAPVSLVVVPRPDEGPEVEALRRTVTGSGSDEARAAAARSLRFRTSEAALRASVALLGASDATNADFHLTFGIVGNPHRRLAIALVEAAIADPARPVDSSMLNLLAVLRAPGSSRAVEHARAVELLRAASPAKVEPARPAVLRALDEADRTAGRSVGAELRARLGSLPDAELQRMLAYEWLRLRDADLVPLLVATIERPATAEPLLGTALSRLGELDPAAARGLLVKHWRRSGPGFLEAWRTLPDATIPALDADLATTIDRPDQRTAYFVERYGTDALAAAATAALSGDPERWGDDEVTGLVPYLLRVRPADGERLLGVAFGTPTLAERRAGLLRPLALRRWSPPVEALCIRLLDHPKSSVAAEAAAVLGRFGGPAAASASWGRLGGLHDGYAARGAVPTGPDAELEAALVQALGTAPGWRLDEAAAARLAALALTDEGRRVAAQARPSPAPSILAWRDWSGETNVRVDGLALSTTEQLARRLALYPRGTSFALSTMVGGVPPQDALLDEVRAAVTAAGHHATGP